MTKPGLTYLQLILDRSGSMANIRSDMEAALNTFIDEQKQVPGDCLVGLVEFDDVVDVVFTHLPIEKVGPIKLLPRNMTALHDAMGQTIIRLGGYFAGLEEDERPEKVLVATITDGLENSSKEFHREQIATMVQEQQEKWNWAFTYLGANQDAVLVGTDLGYDATSSLTYAATSQGTKSATRSLSTATTRFRGATAGAAFGYTDDEREKVAQSDPT